MSFFKLNDDKPNENLYVLELCQEVKIITQGLDVPAFEAKSTYNELTDNEDFSLKIIGS